MPFAPGVCAAKAEDVHHLFASGKSEVNECCNQVQGLHAAIRSRQQEQPVMARAIGVERAPQCSIVSAIRERCHAAYTRAAYTSSIYFGPPRSHVVWPIDLLVICPRGYDPAGRHPARRIRIYRSVPRIGPCTSALAARCAPSSTL